MSLNESNAPKTTSYTPPKAGMVYARVIGLIDRGIQAQEFKGEAKPAAQEVDIIVELPFDLITITTKDDAGNEVEKEMPRWITRTVSIKQGDRAFYPKVKAALGAKDLYDMLGKLCQVNIEHYEKKNNGGTGAKLVSFHPFTVSVPDMTEEQFIAQYPQLQKPATDYRVFDFDEPSQEVWDKLPKFQQDIIKSAINFDTIADKLNLGGAPTAPTAPAPGSAPTPPAPPAPGTAPAPANTAPPAPDAGTAPTPPAPPAPPGAQVEDDSDPF